MRLRATVYRPSSTSRASDPFSPDASARSSRSTVSPSTTAPMIWPPSKPISMRVRSATRDQLGEYAVGGVGMDERDLHPEQARPRRCVDQFRAFVLEPGQLLGQVVDLVGDVVHTR